MPFRRGLIITEYFPPVVGGSARWFEVLVKEARQFAWTVVTQPQPGARERESLGRHLVIRPSWWQVPPSLFKLRTVLAYQKLFIFLDEIVRRERPEVIHAMPVYGAAFPALLIGEKYSIPVVTHVFGEEFGMEGRSLYRRWIMKRVLGGSRAIVANSEQTLERSCTFGGEPAKSEVLFMIDLSQLNPMDNAGSRRKFGITAGPILLTLSRLVARKGIDSVIRAVERLKDVYPGLVYLVGGEGPDLDRLTELVRRGGVEPWVRFLGRVPDEELAALYSAADLFVMPNRELDTGEIEGLGFVFLEAAACGIPSIGGRSGGAPTAVLDGSTGILVDPFSIDDLVAAVRALIDDEPRRKALGIAARNRVLEVCNAARNVGVFESIHARHC